MMTAKRAPSPAAPQRAPLSRSFVSSTMSVALLLSALIGCGVDEVGFPPPTESLYYPLGVAAHPEGRYVYVSSSSYDRRYNASALIPLDTFTGELLSDSAVETGLFSGELKLASRGCRGDAEGCEPKTFALLPSRDERSLTVIKVSSEAGDSAEHLSCGQASLSGGEGRRCSAEHMITEVNGEPLPADPYGLHLDEGGLLMTHLKRGAISRWRFAPLAQDPKSLPVFECQITTGNAHLITRHPSSGLTFVSDRFGQVVSALRAAPTQNGSCRFTPQPSISLNSGLLNSEGRGVAMSADGTLMYHASSADGALRVYDTSLDESGQPRATLLAVIPVGREANMVRVAGLRAGERRVSTAYQGAAERRVDELGGGLVYVSALGDDVVAVVDPQRLEVIARVKVGHAPHDIAFLPNEAGELRGFVSNFQGHSLSVIDLQEGSPTRFQELSRVGEGL